MAALATSTFGSQLPRQAACVGDTSTSARLISAGRAQDSAHDRAHHQTRRDRPNRHDRDIAEFPRFAKRANAA
jgi:hypothetical protein